MLSDSDLVQVIQMRAASGSNPAAATRAPGDVAASAPDAPPAEPEAAASPPASPSLEVRDE